MLSFVTGKHRFNLSVMASRAHFGISVVIDLLFCKYFVVTKCIYSKAKLLFMSRANWEKRTFLANFLHFFKVHNTFFVIFLPKVKML